MRDSTDWDVGKRLKQNCRCELGGKKKKKADKMENAKCEVCGVNCFIFNILIVEKITGKFKMLKEEEKEEENEKKQEKEIIKENRFKTLARNT